MCLRQPDDWYPSPNALGFFVLDAPYIHSDLQGVGFTHLNSFTEHRLFDFSFKWVFSPVWTRQSRLQDNFYDYNWHILNYDRHYLILMSVKKRRILLQFQENFGSSINPARNIFSGGIRTWHQRHWQLGHHVLYQALMQKAMLWVIHNKCWTAFDVNPTYDDDDLRTKCLQLSIRQPPSITQWQRWLKSKTTWHVPQFRDFFNHQQYICSSKRKMPT